MCGGSARTATLLDPLSPRGFYRQSRILATQRKFSEAGALFLQTSQREPSSQLVDGQVPPLTS